MSLEVRDKNLIIHWRHFFGLEISTLLTRVLDIGLYCVTIPKDIQDIVLIVRRGNLHSKKEKPSRGESVAK